MDARTVAKKLINLPAVDRQWIMNNVVPSTFARWCRQGSVALRAPDGSPRSFNEKIRDLREGREELSELSKHESKLWPVTDG